MLTVFVYDLERPTGHVQALTNVIGHHFTSESDGLCPDVRSIEALDPIRVFDETAAVPNMKEVARHDGFL